MQFLPVSRRAGLSVAMGLCCAAGLPPPSAHAESLDFTAEHVLEIPMDFRYSSLPKPPSDPAVSERRIGLGLGEVAGERMRNRFPMLSVSNYLPREAGGGWLFGAFYDRFAFAGVSGNSRVRPSFGQPAGLPDDFAVRVDDVSGSGYHVGVSMARAFTISGGGSVQVGAVASRLHVGEYRVDFTSLGLAADFSGFVDYAGNYDSIAPFVSWDGARRRLGAAWTGVPSVVLAWPLPRRGFQGRLVGPGFDVAGDTAAVGNGRHIPDVHLGLGFTIEHAPSGLRADIGASVFGWLAEPRVHRNIDRALFLNVTFPF